MKAVTETEAEPETPPLAAPVPSTPPASEELPQVGLDHAVVEPPAMSQTPPSFPPASLVGSRPTFKVSAIMSGPDGGAALVNGRMVYVGQTVDGARLVGVSSNSVQLLVGDKQVTVGLQE